MLIIPGANALSAFRAAKIFEQLRTALPQCVAVQARYMHFVDVVRELTDAEMEKLMRLLDYGRAHDNDDENQNQQQKQKQNQTKNKTQKGNSAWKKIITPRLGTISPWSSKASEIVHRCGLQAVHRVERGVEWRIIFDTAMMDMTDITDMTQVAKIILPLIHDPMTESAFSHDAPAALFDKNTPQPLRIIDLLGGGLAALQAAENELGFALNASEREYLLTQFKGLGRNPSDVELMMFAQVNSEHCRHKIFNADWRIDGQRCEQSPFAMIRQTHAQSSDGTLVAYRDNAAVLRGQLADGFFADPDSRIFGYRREAAHFVAKVETHNHPTAISPFAGAATGSGGEIRDEGATGRGGKPKAGVVGYSVSHLRLPDDARAWEGAELRPARIASPLQIMLDAPIGAAAFNNEFGRAAIGGYFRNFECVADGIHYGYHKPIMLAGGIGAIRTAHVHKKSIPDGAPLVVIGGAAMLIGIGGGAASSVAAGDDEARDYASVQRANAEMQRRCQQVIDACIALDRENPILSIHDVGAGGLSNALPELVHDAKRGATFELRAVANDAPGMTPMQIWCNEAQERYVLAIAPARLAQFTDICRRERCPLAIVGHATEAQRLRVKDEYFAAAEKINGNAAQHAMPVDVPMEMLFGKPPTMQRDVVRIANSHAPLNFDIDVARAAERVLDFPSVADKTFLITIGDRSVGGQVAREQMVGPWQVPVADVGVVADGYRGKSGQAIAIGERAPLAVIDAAAAARIAVGEAITNIAAARIENIGDIKLSANWMAAAGEAGHDADLYDAVRATTKLCSQLGLSIPVGKDSMAMKTIWHDNARHADGAHKVVAPLSLVVTAFAPVADIGATATPQLSVDGENAENDLWLIDLARGKNRLGGSVLAQVHGQIGNSPPDVDDAKCLKNFFGLIQSLNRQGLLLAYHDRADGGLLATLCEMAFAARCGLRIDFAPGDLAGDDALAVLALLFGEELGAVIQTARARRENIAAQIRQFELDDAVHRIGHAVAHDDAGDEIVICTGAKTWLQTSRAKLHKTWSQTSFRMQSLRDNPDCAVQEYARIEAADGGLFSRTAFDHKIDIAASFSHRRPKIAVLREQGINGQLEMAAAFDCAGFDAVDVTMSDLNELGAHSLADYRGFVACGGFSFGDVLGAGEGWAKSILYNPRLREMFGEFFARNDTFALGVCNGCQMMAAIAELIPGAEHWPTFVDNHSAQFEARTVMVEICSDKSIFFRGMKNAKLPIVTAHGEGRARFAANHRQHLEAAAQICLRFIDHAGNPTETYPANPNGSPAGATGFTNADGRFTILMPHPERVIRAVCNSWRPHRENNWGEYSPWIQMFRNARVWVG